MTIPTSKASTNNVDQGSDKISLARPDIKQNIDNVNEIIDHLNASASGTMLIPLTGFVVVKSAHDSFDDSAGGDGNFYRMGLLGGAYYLRNGSTEPSLTAAVTSNYGVINGASVNNSTSITKTEPTGLSISTSTTTVSITDGVISSNNSNGVSNASVGSLSSNGYVGYYTGYDSYVRLPAGTYTLELKTLISSVTDNYVYEASTNETDNSFSANDSTPDFWIYNKTDGTEITNADVENNDISDFADWNKDGQVIFTLSGTKDIAFYNPADTYDADSGRLKLKLTTSVQTTGDFFGAPITQLNPVVDWYDGSNYIPARLGWVTPIERTFIKITKLA
jgi:hypothetical protein